MATEVIDFPNEIIEKLQAFHHCLKRAEESLSPLRSVNINSSDVKLTSLDKARLNLTCGYALNSLFWMYLNTLGIDSKSHRIKTELARFKSYMMRVKEITERDQAPILNKEAAQRFVRNALWEPQRPQDALSSEEEEIDEISNLKRTSRVKSSSAAVKRKKRH